MQISKCRCFFYSGQRFDKLPSNATVTEGGCAKFECTVLLGDPHMDTVWGVKVPGETEQNLLLVNNISMIDLKDGSTAFVKVPDYSLLIIANVNRSLNGTQVRCFFMNSTLISQDKPYAILTVQCKLLATVPNVCMSL